ncbi:MAG: yajC [Sphingomonas bacterium]|jgi:preprotein translocase subunit YajC|nr:yajC [Sphingomonas bacterium]
MFSSPAFAQTVGAPAPSGGLASLSFFVPMILILGIWTIFMIIPQRRQVKAHQAKLAAAKKGDVVVTGGGLIGRVTKADGDEIEIELAPNVRVRAVRSTLTDVRGSGKPAND